MGIGDFFKKGKKAVTDKVSDVKSGAQQKLLEQQLKKLPAPQREALMNAIQSDPDFFRNLEKEIKDEVAAGKSQMAAAMTVMRKHQGRLQELMMQGQAKQQPKPPKGK